MSLSSLYCTALWDSYKFFNHHENKVIELEAATVEKKAFMGNEFWKERLCLKLIWSKMLHDVLCFAVCHVIVSASSYSEHITSNTKKAIRISENVGGISQSGNG